MDRIGPMIDRLVACWGDLLNKRSQPIVLSLFQVALAATGELMRMWGLRLRDNIGSSIHSYQICRPRWLILKTKGREKWIMQGNTPQYRKLLIKNLANPDGSKLKPPKGKTATIQDSTLLATSFPGFSPTCRAGRREPWERGCAVGRKIENTVETRSSTPV